MRRRSLLFLLAGAAALAGSSCTMPLAAPSGELGQRFKETIPGTWVTEIHFEGGFAQSEKTFRADGTAKGTMSLRQRSGGTSFVMPMGSFRSKWRLEGDTYISYDIDATIPRLFPKGTEIRDRVLSVSPNRIVCRAEEGGSVFSMERKR